MGIAKLKIALKLPLLVILAAAVSVTGVGISNYMTAEGEL